MIDSAFDLDTPPCPWCRNPVGIKQVKRWGKDSYCPHCRRCVVKYLQFGDTSGLIVTGWYWGKHTGHVTEREGKGQ